MSTIEECLAQACIELIDRLHNIVKVGRRVEPGHREVCKRTGAVHARVLKHGVLLEAIGSAAVIETNQVADGQTTVKDLTTNEDVEAIAKLKLSLPVEKIFDVVLRVDFLNLNRG